MNAQMSVTPFWTAFQRQLLFLWQSRRVFLLFAASAAGMFYVELQRVSHRGVAMATLSAQQRAIVTAAYADTSIMSTAGFMLVIGAAWAIFVWRGENWGRREYLSSLPLSLELNSVLRIAAGGIWFGVAVLIVAIVGSFMSHLHGSGVVHFNDGSHMHFSGRAAFWANFFSGPLIVYLLVTILSVATSRPAAWLVGILCGWFAFILVSSNLGITGPTDFWIWMLDDRFGVYSALRGGMRTEYLDRLAEFFGNPVEFDRTMFPQFSVANWLLASVLWISVGVAGIAVALRRKP